MKKIFLAVCAAMVSAGAWAQYSTEVNAEWSVTVAPTEDALEVVFEAVVPEGWHIYDMGPYDIPSMATSFDFSALRGVELVSEVRQLDEPERKFDDVFGFEVGYFEGTARFAQRVRVLGKDAGAAGGASGDSGDSGAALAGEVEYQVCSDEACVRGVWEFDVAIEGALGDGGDAGVGGSDRDALSGPTGDTNIWSMILMAVLAGFLALLTPCVFPMVPMTVSFFIKDGGSARLKALSFGGFIVGLYTLPTAAIFLAIYFAGGGTVTAGAFNWFATSWINVIFFVVFMAFAASLLGAFEIRMPSRLVNRSDKGVDKGGLVGVFFLALTLVLVSFSCTVPIVGTALVYAALGEFWMPIVTMMVFSAAFALPFTLLAFFPELLKKLPKSGGWLNSVKVVLGLVEIALGLKFLSVADQTYHWGILPREVYLAIWIVVFTLLGFYLLGKIRFKYDSPVEHIGVGRLAGAIAVFAFVVWLVPGMFGAPLRAISGYLPPRIVEASYGVAGDGVPGAGSAGVGSSKIKYADKLRLPHGLVGYFDFEEGLAHAREVGRPVFLDFTGHGCVNCREMEERVWSDPEVLRILRDDYVIIALYSDDRTSLAEADRVTTPGGKVLKSLGRANSYFMSTRYGISSQPAYLLLDTDGNLLAPPRGYSLDIEAFVEFLGSGLAAN